MRRLFLVALLGLAACGVVNPLGPTPSAGSVALTSHDLPPGLVRCSESGDVNSYLALLHKRYPNLYGSTTQQWDAVKAKGGEDAWIAVYADDASECQSLFVGGGTSRTNPRIVENLVFKFKDDSSAARAYRNGIFGMNGGSANGMPGATHGGATGLGANSFTVSESQGGRTVYAAFWQHGSFDLVFRSEDLSAAAAKQAVHAIDGRI